MYEPIATQIVKNVNAKFEGELLTVAQEVGFYIDREELLKALMYDRGQYEKGYADGKADAVKHGEWYQKRITVPKARGHSYLVWACSVCHKHERKRSDFCPNCGADMRGKNNV